MRITVTQDYIDKETRCMVTAGESLDVSDERGAELINKGYAEESNHSYEKRGRGRAWTTSSQDNPTDENMM